MTDKELRKLSRLELLELLLEVSKENEKLKEETEKLKAADKTAANIENLTLATEQVENALRYVSGLADALKTLPKSTVPAKEAPEAKNPQSRSSSLSDREIYKRMICFFANNDEKLAVFPRVLENDIRKRINVLLRKNNEN